MIGTNEDHIKLLGLLHNLPDTSDVTISVHGLTRHEFDNLPGSDEYHLEPANRWTKEMRGDGIVVDLYTVEAPFKVIQFPPQGQPDLKLVS